MMILKEFSRIVCVSLFSYQGSLFVCLSDSSFTLSHSSAPVKYFFQVFFEVFWCLCVALRRLVYSITCSFICQQLFLFFSKLFKLFVQKKQLLVTAQLEYHYKKNLSTLFWTFFIFCVILNKQPWIRLYKETSYTIEERGHLSWNLNLVLQLQIQMPAIH